MFIKMPYIIRSTTTYGHRYWKIGCEVLEARLRRTPPTAFAGETAEQADDMPRITYKFRYRYSAFLDVPLARSFDWFQRAGSIHFPVLESSYSCSRKFSANRTFSLFLSGASSNRTAPLIGLSSFLLWAGLNRQKWSLFGGDFFAANNYISVWYMRFSATVLEN